jgi:hypothetical protein
MQTTTTAKFHSVRSEKSALILVKGNPLEFSSKPAYVPISGLAMMTGQDVSTLEQGYEFEIQTGFKLVDIVDLETGEVRTAKDGSPLKQLQY